MADPSWHTKSAFIGSFYGDYFFWVNVVAVVLQAFAASRLVRRTWASGGAVLALSSSPSAPTALIGAGGGFDGRALGQDGGECDRLLGHEHRTPDAVAADPA